MFRLALIGLSITIILPAIKSATGCCAQKRTDIDQGAEADIYLDDLSEPNEKDLANFLDSGERQVEYDDQLSTLEEYPEAEAKLVEASIQVANIMDNVKKGDNLDILAIKGTVQPMLDSIIKNVDALLWMLKLNDGQQTYQQAIENSVLAMAFGRHLGLNMSDIRNLAVGMLLLDVGKLRINPEILNKTGLLTREEFEAVKQHVNLGVKMLKSTLGINRSIITMVETHHERYDGSGYPNGLSGQQIPLYGVIAGIIDTYTSMIRPRPHRPAISPHQVLQGLYDWRNKFFQNDIVEQFLQCVGVYPTGSLVEMSTGEVGIVIAQNFHDRLEPTTCMLLDENKDPWTFNPIIDLSKNRTDANGRRRRIEHALKDGAYGISAVETQRILAKQNI